MNHERDNNQNALTAFSQINIANMNEALHSELSLRNAKIISKQHLKYLDVDCGARYVPCGNPKRGAVVFVDCDAHAHNDATMEVRL